MTGEKKETTPAILVIDDDAVIREVLGRYLETRGYRVLLAGDGRAGLRIFAAERPDLLLVDLKMPGLDGLEVLKRVRKASPETPVLIISGAGDIGTAVTAIRLGAWDYLFKPFSDLVVVDHAIRRAREKARLIRENRNYRKNLERANRQLKKMIEKLEEDEKAGRRVQFRMLPKEKSYGSYEFSRYLKPSRYLSGDFLDYFYINEDYLGFYIADVSGHGISSAFVTVFLKSYVSQAMRDFRGEGSLLLLDPAGLLRGLNRVLLEEDLGKYLTIYCGVIEVKKNRLRFCNGGQFPFPILFDTRRASYLRVKGAPVGLFESPHFTNTEMNLPEKFAMLFSSDGVLPLLSRVSLKEQEEELLAAVGSLDISLAGLVRSLGISSRSRLPDDVTLLMVKRR